MSMFLNKQFLHVDLQTAQGIGGGGVPKTLRIKSSVTFAQPSAAPQQPNGQQHLPVPGMVKRPLSSGSITRPILKKKHTIDFQSISGGVGQENESLPHNYNNAFSTSDSSNYMFRSSQATKSPLIEHTITSFGGNHQANTTMTSLADEYRQKQKEMDERLKKEIDQHKVASIYVGQSTAEKGPLPFQEKPQKFVRSDRSIAMRIKEKYENQVSVLEQEKMELLKRLNDSLMDLDRLNQEKGDLNNKLISIFKFNRDAERQTLRSDDLGTVVDESLKEELRFEKQQGVHLKEQLKYSEVERLRIRDSMAHAEQVNDQVSNNREELGAVLAQMERDVASLRLEYDETAERIVAYQKEVDELRQLCLSLQEMITGHKNDVHCSHGGRLSLRDQFDNLEKKYARVVDTRTRELQDINHRHQRKRKLLGANFLLLKVISVANARAYQSTLNSLKKHATVRKWTVQGLLRMRRILKQNKLSRLRKALYKWYFDELKPLRNRRQMDLVGSGMGRRLQPLMLAFSKWRSAYEDKIIKHHYRQQKVQRLITIREHQSKVAAQEFLLRWKYNINLRYSEWHKIQVLGKMLVKKDEQRMRSRLYRWKAVSLELENNLQIQVMAQRFTLKTYISQLFHSWRTVIRDSKCYRHATLSRTLKSLRAYVSLKKQLRCQALMLLREGKLRTSQNQLKACFDGLKQHKQQEKLDKTTFELNDVEIPRKVQCIQDTEALAMENAWQQREKSLLNVVRIRMKKFYQYFRLWKDLTDEYHEKMRTDMKQRVIKLYLRHLSQAFNKWVSFRSQSITDQQKLTISTQEVDNKNVSNEITDQSLVIDDMKFHQKSQSAKSLKILVMEAFERHIRLKFMNWRQNVRQLSLEAQSAERLIEKLERRYKKLAFYQYKQKVLLSRQEQRDILRGREAKDKLRDILKQRTFKRIVAHTNLMLDSKKKLFIVLKKHDKFNKDEIMRQWDRFLQFKREERLENIQNGHVEKIQNQQHQIGYLGDQVENQNVKIRYLDKKYIYKCSRILGVALSRNFHMSQQFYFERWRQVLQREHVMKRMLTDCITHQRKSQLSHFFHLWLQNGSIFTLQIPTTHCIQNESRIIIQVSHERALAQNQHEASVESLETKLSKVQNDSQILEAKHSRCLTTIVNRVDGNFRMLRIRYILTQWREFVAHRKRYCVSMVNAIQKTLWQNAFTTLRLYSNHDMKDKRREKFLSNFFSIFKRQKQRAAFHRLKSQLQVKANQIIKVTCYETIQAIKEQSKLIKVIHSRAQGQVVEHRNHTRTFDCFTAWRNQIEIEKAIKVKTQLFQRTKLEKQRKINVQKWQKRTQATLKYRKITETLQNLYAENLAKTAFQAWQEMNYRAKRFCRSLSNLANKVDSVYLNRAFSTLKDNQTTLNTRILFSKFKGIQFLITNLQSIHDTRFRQSFTHLREVVVGMKKREMGMRAINKYWVSKQLRDHLVIWSQEARLRTVKLFNNGEGPIATEAHRLHQQLNALKNLCRDEGISSQKVAQIIQTCKTKSTERYMRVLSRILCNGDPQTKVMPHCFDRWRQWVQLRKLFQYWLKYTSNFVNPVRQGMSYAFRKWKETAPQLSKELKAIKKVDLDYISVKNEEKIAYMARTFQESAEAIGDLTTQRDLLLVRYVGSQKLALSSIKAQNERTKQKVVSKWLSQNQRAEKQQIEHVLKLNLMKIAALKDRICKIEGRNQEIADQNEDLRQGALDGIEMAKSVDDLTRERELLTIDIADKALIIRRLLEDNSSLNSQLNHAQEAAQRLIHITQRRLQQQQYQ